MPTNDHSSAESWAAGLEVEVRLLRGQLADKERAIQRLLIIEDQQAREITSLRAQLALVEAAASV